MEKTPSSLITPESLYLNRRKFIKAAGALVAGPLILNACEQVSGAVVGGAANTMPDTTGIDEPTAYESIIKHNNFYEFSTSKDDVWKLAKDFISSPWKLTVTGLVNKPKTYDIDSLMKKFTQVERVYRFRCVEAWSMVVPWSGFPLAELLKEADPKSNAKYLKFVTLYDPDQMPRQNSLFSPWPYVEGMRIDEAMNELAMLATGIYGKPLKPQCGAPIRLVAPWKYGFKSIKSIVKIELVEDVPVSFWMKSSPHEYGFYANVNPKVDHPRWSQASEKRLGELFRRKTLMFNGYEKQVAHLYEGLNLRKNF